MITIFLILFYRPFTLNLNSNIQYITSLLAITHLLQIGLVSSHLILLVLQQRQPVFVLEYLCLLLTPALEEVDPVEGFFQSADFMKLQHISE
jgi:hypothetical protein